MCKYYIVYEKYRSIQDWTLSNLHPSVRTSNILDITQLKSVSRKDENLGMDDYLQGSISSIPGGCFQKRNSFLPPMAHISSQRTTDVISSRNDGFKKEQFTDFTSFKKKMSRIDPISSEFDPTPMRISKNSDITPSVIGWNHIATKKQAVLPKKISSRYNYI